MSGPVMSGDLCGGGEFPELVQQVGPILQQLNALRPVFGPIVCPANLVLVLVGEGSFNYVVVVSALVKDRTRGRTEAVRAHLILGVAHSPKRGVHRVFGEWLYDGSDGWKHQSVVLG